MTRKQALLYAIERTKESNPDAAAALMSIYRDMPALCWSTDACRDAIEQFYIDNNRYPKSNEYNTHPNLPSRSVVEKRLGVDFILNCASRNRESRKNAALKQFVAEYDYTRPFSGKMYNEKRRVGVIRWQAVARLWGQKTWSGLVKFAQLKPIPRQPRPEDYSIVTKGGIWEIERRIAAIEERIKNS